MFGSHKLNRLLKHPGYNGGGGGGNTTATTYTSSLPEYAEPYFKDVMGRAQGASLTPYQQYEGQRVAGFSPYQQTSQALTAETALGGTPEAMQLGQQAGAMSAGRLAGYEYDPTRFGYMGISGPQLAQYQMGPAQQVQAGQMGYQGVNAATLGAPERIQAGQVGFERVDPYAVSNYERVAAGQLGQQLSAADTGTVSRFMSPYMQNVVDVEKQAAARDYQIAEQARRAQAATAGAFGGSRHGVMEAEAQRGLMSQLQGIQTKGTQSAFETAQRALEAERAVEMQRGTTNIQTALEAARANQQAGLTAGQYGLQAALANQQAGLTAGQQNLQSMMEAQRLNQATGLTAAQANQQAMMDAQRLNQAAGLTSGQQNLQSMMEAQRLNQQAGLTVGQQNLQSLLSTQQLGAQTSLEAQRANQQAYAEALRQSEASRQFGATSGMQALQQLGTQAKDLASMGQAEQQMAFDRASQLGKVGSEQQALQQRQMDQAYEEFSAARDYQQNMINWYNAILRGTPVNMNQTVYQTAQQPSMLSQLGGLGLAGYGMYQAANK